MAQITFKKLQELAGKIGLAVVGVADTEAMTQDMEYLRRWQAAGYAGDMAFMQRDPELLSSPKRVANGARSVVVIGAFYDRGERPVLPHSHGRVARYAWGRDYHKVLRKKLESLCRLVEQSLGSKFEYRVFADSVPLLERALARQAGLGFVGKNSMVIMPGAGSFMFLGEVLWSLEVSELPEVQDDEYEGDNGRLRSALGKSHCGSCSRCIDYCPTSALVADRVLDARRCISYLTIEKRGSLTHQERTWIGEWVFGCDICQDVCPFNVVSIKSRAKPDCSEFLPSAGVGCSLELSEVIAIRSDAEFVKRFGGTPLMRAKREGLVRNAAVVSANKRVFEVLEGLKSAVREDRSAVVRSHALWAFAQLSSELGSHAVTMLKDLVYLCCVDEDLSVRIEADEISQKLA